MRQYFFDLETHLFTCHSKSTDEQADVSSTDHDGLAAVGALRFSGVFVLQCRPYSNNKDQEVEDRDSHQPLYMDGHCRTGLG